MCLPPSLANHTFPCANIQPKFVIILTISLAANRNHHQSLCTLTLTLKQRNCWQFPTENYTNKTNQLPFVLPHTRIDTRKTSNQSFILLVPPTEFITHFTLNSLALTETKTNKTRSTLNFLAGNPRSSSHGAKDSRSHRS